MLKFYVANSYKDIDNPEKWELKCTVENSEMGTIPVNNEYVIMDNCTYNVHRRYFYVANNEANVNILCTPH